jgi:hypothetical protein
VELVQVNLAKRLGLPADLSEDAINAALMDACPRDADRVLAELGRAPEAATTEAGDLWRSPGALPLRVIGC